MRREALWEYLRGALWVLPTLAVIVTLAVGYALAAVDAPATGPLVFQGTADDARTLLIAIASTMATVIALVLGLTVVTLQLASTQFSPRLLRNFLRDRTNQALLSVFVATFAYSSAGLYTVGVSAGQRVDEFPRLAVSMALVLLFLSLVALIAFVHHLAHSIQLDEVMARVERNTLRVIGHDLPTLGVTGEPLPEVPDGAVAVPAYRTGYVQTMHPEVLLPAAVAHDLTICGAAMVGQYVIAGSPLLWCWGGAPGALDGAGVIRDAVRIGFERTTEQDVAFGVRQLADIAMKALSAAINDPYTATQAIEHLGVLLAALAGHPLGNQHIRDEHGAARVSIPGRDLAYFLDLAIGQVRRCRPTETGVIRAVLRALADTGRFCPDAERREMVAEQIRLVVKGAAAHVEEPADLAPVRAHADQVLNDLTP